MQYATANQATEVLKQATKRAELKRILETLCTVNRTPGERALLARPVANENGKRHV